MHLRLALPQENVGVADVAARAHGVEKVIDLRAAHGGDEDHLLDAGGDGGVDLRLLPEPIHLRGGTAVGEIKLRATVLHPREHLGHDGLEDGQHFGLGDRGGEDDERVHSAHELGEIRVVGDVALHELHRVGVGDDAANFVCGLGRADQTAGRREVRGAFAQEFHHQGTRASAGARDRHLHPGVGYPNRDSGGRYASDAGVAEARQRAGNARARRKRSAERERGGHQCLSMKDRAARTPAVTHDEPSQPS